MTWEPVHPDEDRFFTFALNIVNKAGRVSLLIGFST